MSSPLLTSPSHISIGITSDPDVPELHVSSLRDDHRCLLHAHDMLQRLPRDLALYSMEWLSRSDLGRVAQVSHGWARLQRHERLWRQVHARYDAAVEGQPWPGPGDDPRAEYYEAWRVQEEARLRQEEAARVREEKIARQALADERKQQLGRCLPVLEFIAQAYGLALAPLWLVQLLLLALLQDDVYEASWMLTLIPMWVFMVISVVMMVVDMVDTFYFFAHLSNLHFAGRSLRMRQLMAVFFHGVIPLLLNALIVLFALKVEDVYDVSWRTVAAVASAGLVSPLVCMLAGFTQLLAYHRRTMQPKDLAASAIFFGFGIGAAASMVIGGSLADSFAADGPDAFTQRDVFWFLATPLLVGYIGGSIACFTVAFLLLGCVAQATDERLDSREQLSIAAKHSALVASMSLPLVGLELLVVAKLAGLLAVPYWSIFVIAFGGLGIMLAVIEYIDRYHM